MLGSLLKATVGVVVNVPLSMAADVVTLGGAITDKPAPYTAEAVSNVLSNVHEAVKL